MNDRQERALNGAVLSWWFKVPVLVVMALFSITCGSNLRRKTAVASAVGILMLIAIVTTMVVAAPSAFAASSRRYEGTTSQDLRVWFELEKRADGSFRLERWDFKAELSCDDGSVLVWGAPGWRQPLDQGVVTLDEVNPWGATHLHGTFRPRSAEGTFRYTMGALTDDEQPQLCTTGELMWTADRTVPPVAESAPSWGDIALEGLESGQDIDSSASLSRRYQGKTSQDKKITFDLDQEEDDGSLTLVGWFLKARATCGDGTAWGFATGSNHAVPLDGRNLALQRTDATWTLDLHGAFRPKTADGTLRWNMAALTADEQAQLCTMGDLTWTADRVDESIMPSSTGIAGPEIRRDFAQPTPLAVERRLR